MIDTALTDLFSLEHPIVLAPMGGVSGGLLAAAVSNAGGLGLVGGGYGDPVWLERELSLASMQARRPWGVGLITWSAGRSVVELALSYRPHAVMLSFGDPRPHARTIKSARCRLICQVQDLASARLAVEAGADLIVAQGTEGGGHGGTRAALALVPAVVDIAGMTPVLAAGGIADGRGLAAALMLGAQGALIGTRFYASRQALGSDRAKLLIARTSGDQTRRTSVFDVVRKIDWPTGHTGRALKNSFMSRWHGREPELAESRATESPAFFKALEEGDFNTGMVWAGEGIDLITDVEDAVTLVHRISAEAEQCLVDGARHVKPERDPDA